MRLVTLLMLLAQAFLTASAAAQDKNKPRLDGNGDPLPEGAVARLGTTRFQPSTHADASALSPDGSTVAIATKVDNSGMRISLLDTKTGEISRMFEVPGAWGQQLHFTPDGKSLVLSGWSAIKIVDATTGKVARSIDLEGAGDLAIAVSADGSSVAAQPSEHVYDVPIRVWETKTGKQLPSLPGRGARCRGLTFGPDGKHLLVWSTIPTEAGKQGLSFGPECKGVVACIDVDNRKIVGEAIIGTAQHVALCQDGETIAVETADHSSVCVRHLPSGAERCTIAVKNSRFAFTPNGEKLFTIDADGSGALWSAVRGDKIRNFEGNLASKSFSIIGVSETGWTIAALDGNWRAGPIVVVWDAATGKRIARPPAHADAVTCLAYAPDGKLLVSGSVDRTVRLWNPVTGEHVRVLTTFDGAVTAVAISPDGRLVASSSEAAKTRLLAVADGKLIAEFSGPTKGAGALAFSKDGTVLFAGGRSPELLGWDIKAAKETVRLKTGDDGAVMALADGGAWALTANGEARAPEVAERLQVWSPPSELPLMSIKIGTARDDVLLRRFGREVYCEAAIFSPGGRLIAASQISEYQGIRPSYGNDLLRLWERSSGEPIVTLSPTVTRVLAFSPSGRLLASGAAGKSGHLRMGFGAGVDFWDVVSGKKAGTLPVTPECCAFSPDGSYLATGGQDKQILIWEAPGIQFPDSVKLPTSLDCDAWWIALGDDAKDAFQAIGQMLDAPEDAVALLKERVKPIPSAEPKTVAMLIAQLESESFEERMVAHRALEKIGEGATHLLMKAIEDKPSLEVRRRLEELLERCNETTTLSKQQHRAVATLEWIGTPTARELLRTFAEGAPRARLTLEARGALERLKD